MKYSLTKNYYGIHQRVIREINKQSSILEIGTAQGYLTKILNKEKKCIITGMEIDSEAADITSEFCKKMYTTDIEKFNFKKISDESFNAVLCLDVIEHLIDPEKLLDELAVLRNGTTKFYFSVPNVVNYVVRLKILFGHFTYTERGILDKTHLHFYTFKTFKKMLEDTGFIVLKSFAAPQLPFSYLGKFGYLITKVRPTLMSSHIFYQCI